MLNLLDDLHWYGDPLERGLLNLCVLKLHRGVLSYTKIVLNELSAEFAISGREGDSKFCCVLTGEEDILLDLINGDLYFEFILPR